MDDLPRCPTNYCYINAFSSLQSIIQTINYITFYLKPLKIDSEASLFCTYISFILILYYFYIIYLFLYCIFIIIYQNLEICLNPYFSQFFRQQVILPFFKNALKSILVCRFFSHFSVIFKNAKIINNLVVLEEFCCKSYYQELNPKHITCQIKYKNVLKTILKRLIYKKIYDLNFIGRVSFYYAK